MRDQPDFCADVQPSSSIALPNSMEAAALREAANAAAWSGDS